MQDEQATRLGQSEPVSSPMQGYLPPSPQKIETPRSSMAAMLPHQNKALEYGLLLYIFLIPFARLTHYLEYFFLVLVGVWLIREATLRRVSLRRTPIDVPLLAFVVWVFLTAWTATDPAYSLTEWQKILPKILMFYFVVNVVEGEKQAMRLALAFVAGACLQSVIGIVKFVGSFEELSAIWPGFASGQFFSGQFREGSLTGSSQWLSTYLVMAMPFLWLGLRKGSRPEVRWLYLGGLSLAMIALLLTHTRAAWVALVVQVIVLISLKVTRSGVATASVGMLAVLALFTMLTLFSQFREQGQVHQAMDMTTMQIRFNTWEMAGSELLSHPVTGLGYGRHSFGLAHPGLDRTERYHAHIHNTFLSTAVQVGIPGFVLFVWIFAKVLGTSYRTLRRNTHSFTGHFAEAALLMTVGVIVRNLFDDMFVGTIVYVFCLLVGLGFALGRESESGQYAIR